MYYLVVFLLILLLFLDIKVTIIYLLSIVWFIFYVYYYFYTKSKNDKKIITDEMITMPPNNNKSYYLRYLYQGKCDYKCFILMIMELYLNNSIDIKKYDNDNIYIINNDIPNEKLNNAEENIKKLLFKDIVLGNELSLNTLLNFFKKRSSYSYKRYKEWTNSFLVESAKMNYFKTNKKVLDNVLKYLVLSLILALYHILFTGNYILFIIIFILTVILIIKINNLVIREEENYNTLTEWLKFKNYILKNGIDNYDEKTLECFMLYTYALDIYDKKLLKNNNYQSKFLILITSGLFDIISNRIIESIKNCNFKTIAFFKK